MNYKEIQDSDRFGAALLGIRDARYDTIARKPKLYEIGLPYGEPEEIQEFRDRLNHLGIEVEGLGCMTTKSERAYVKVYNHLMEGCEVRGSKYTLGYIVAAIGLQLTPEQRTANYKRILSNG